jgi:hypothetical protein
MTVWDYAAEAAWHTAPCARCDCARDQHEDEGCYGGCPELCEEFTP